MTVRERFLEWAWRHPRWKRRSREAWALARMGARYVHAPRLLEPPEFGDLRHLASEPARQATRRGRVLFLTFRGWSTHAVIETVLAHALQRRGWEAVFATCGGRLPICDVMPVHAAPPMPCRSCSEYATGAISAAGFQPMRLADVIDVARAVTVARRTVAGLSSVQECEEFVAHDLRMGALVRTSVLWFLSRGTLPENPRVLRTYRDFLVSALVVADAFEAILDRLRPDRLVALNGRFFAEAILIALATRRGIGWTTYEKGMLADTVITSVEGYASDVTMAERDVKGAVRHQLTPGENSELDQYLAERRRGDATLDKPWSGWSEDPPAVRRQLGLLENRPLVAMFSNIAWDSAVTGKDLCFPSLGDWLDEGVRWAQLHPEIDMVIRLHPAEVSVTNHLTLDRMADRIARLMPRLPTNVRVVQPTSGIDSYALMDEACAGLVYTSTVGLEMAAMGKPVVVAGATHYRGRGFTLDPENAKTYWETVTRVVAVGMEADVRERTRERARRYAHAFFFRFHHPIHAVHEEGHSRPRLALGAGSLLNPGSDPSLDLIVADLLGEEARPVPARAGHHRAG